MYKTDVDWAPCLLLGHQKINLTVLEAAHERAKRYDARRKKIDQSAESIPCSSHNYPSDTNTKETQTETVATPCTSVGIQTESDDFFVEQNFLNDDKKVHYYTGLPNTEILVATF